MVGDSHPTPQPATAARERRIHEALVERLAAAGRAVPVTLRRGLPVMALDARETDFEAPLRDHVERRLPLVVRAAFEPRIADLEGLREVAGDRPQGGIDRHLDTRQFRPFLIHRRHLPPTLWKHAHDRVTGAHYDNSDNVVLMLSQVKAFVLHPPAAHRALYHRPGLIGRHRSTPLDLEAPDPSRFPRAAALPPPLLAVLAPGDLLYLPSNYTHKVFSYAFDGPILSVNYWFHTPYRLLWRDGGTLAERAYAIAYTGVIELLAMLRAIVGSRGCGNNCCIERA